MRQPAPETLSLDQVFGFRRVTAARSRILETDPRIMDLLEGGELVRIMVWKSCLPPSWMILLGVLCWKAEVARVIEILEG